MSSFTQLALVLAMYLAILFACQWLLEAGRRQLTIEQKARLLDTSSGTRNLAGLPQILLLVIYGLGVQVWPGHFLAVTVILYLLLITSMAVVSVVFYRRVSSLDLPAFYVRRFVLSQSLRLGVLVFLCGYLIFLGGLVK